MRSFPLLIIFSASYITSLILGIWPQGGKKHTLLLILWCWWCLLTLLVISQDQEHGVTFKNGSFLTGQNGKVPELSCVLSLLSGDVLRVGQWSSEIGSRDQASICRGLKLKACFLVHILGGPKLPSQDWESQERVSSQVIQDPPREPFSTLIFFCLWLIHYYTVLKRKGAVKMSQGTNLWSGRQVGRWSSNVQLAARSSTRVQLLSSLCIRSVRKAAERCPPGILALSLL